MTESKTETTAAKAAAKVAEDWPHPSPPPPVEVDPDKFVAAEGQKVVQSPTGTKSIVSEAAVASLKTQGYKVVD